MGVGENNFRLWQYILLALVLLFGFFIVYKVHLSYSGDVINPYSGTPYVDVKNYYYPYPLHADEFTHLASAEYIMNEGSIPHINPYVQSEKNTDIEAGFHSFIASIFTITGLNPVMFYQLLPAIFIVITMLSLFLLVFVLTDNYWIALLSALFISIVKSNINLTGLWFMIPLTFSLFLIFMSLAAYFSKGKIRYLSILFFLAAVFSYPLAAIIIAASVIINECIILVKEKHHPLLKKKYLPYYLISIVLILAIIVFIFKGDLSRFPLIFKYGWTVNFEQTYMPWQMIGWPLFIATMIGIVFSIIKKINRIFLILLLFLLIPMLMYSFLGFTIAVPYQRAFMLFTFMLAPLAAIAVCYVSEYSARAIIKIFRADGKKSFIVANVILAIITLSLISASMFNYYKIDDKRFRLVHYLNDDNYDALLWIRSHYSQNTTMMADIFTAFLTYPVARVQAVALPPSNLEGGDIKSVQSFYYSRQMNDCASMLDILKNEKAYLLLSYGNIGCGYNQVYSKNNVYVYEIS